MSLSIAAGDIINGAEPDRDEATHLREVALAMAEDVPQFARWASSRTIVRRLLVAELAQLHPALMEEVVIAVAQAVARHDPDRLDGRFTEATQKLADTFR